MGANDLDKTGGDESKVIKSDVFPGSDDIAVFVLEDELALTNPVVLKDPSKLFLIKISPFTGTEQTV